MSGEETKIKVAGTGGGVVLINLHNHDTLGKVVNVADLRLLFPDAIGLSYSVGEITSVCSIAEDGKAIMAPPEGWSSPVYNIINASKKTGFETKRKFSFNAWKEKSSEGTSQKAKVKRMETCEINIGIMLLKRNDLCKIRRNSTLGFGNVLVSAFTNSSADDILQKAVSLHRATHEDLPDTEFTLLYSDKTRVDTIPGKPDLKFSPARYVKYTTVERIRDIRLYISPVEDYEVLCIVDKPAKIYAYHSKCAKCISQPSKDSGSITKYVKKPKGILKKEVSFAPHLGRTESEDDLEVTLEEDDSEKVTLMKEKYGSIDITYRSVSQSSYGDKTETVTICLDRQQAMDAALQYEPSQMSIHTCNPVQMGLTVDSISKDGKIYLTTKDDDKSFSFPSRVEQHSDDIIIHGPDEIHGCDSFGVMCGVITTCHGDASASFAWHMNGKPIASGVHLCTIPVNEAGEYRCTVSMGDTVSISKPFVYEADVEMPRNKDKMKCGELRKKSTTQRVKRVRFGGVMHQHENFGQEVEEIKVSAEESEASVTDVAQDVQEVEVLAGENGANVTGSASKQESDRYQFRSIPESEIEYSRSDEIGRGSFGVVYRGVWAGTPVAVKVVSTRQLLQNPKRLLHEAHIHSTLHHPNILQLMGACIQKKHVLILTPYIHGSNLDKLIFQDEASESPMQMDTELKAYIAWQAATAVAYLHNLSPPVIHQDIKPANFILQHNTNVVRLMDLGLARLKSAISTSQGSAPAGCGGGTPLYSAPEVLIDRETAREPADVWGLGCTLLELFTMEPVWDNTATNEDDGDDDNFLVGLMRKKQCPNGLNKLDSKFSKVAECFNYSQSERVTSITVAECLKSTFDSLKFVGFKL